MFSPPAASVNTSSHSISSGRVTVRVSTSAPRTRVVRRSRPSNPNLPIPLMFQICTVRESRTPAGAGPSQKVIVLAMLSPQNEESPGRLAWEVSNPQKTPGLRDLKSLLRSDCPNSDRSGLHLSRGNLALTGISANRTGFFPSCFSSRILLHEAKTRYYDLPELDLSLYCRMPLVPLRMRLSERHGHRHDARSGAGIL